VEKVIYFNHCVFIGHNRHNVQIFIIVVIQKLCLWVIMNRRLWFGKNYEFANFVRNIKYHTKSLFEIKASIVTGRPII
jgi:hypothetical protein